MKFPFQISKPRRTSFTLPVSRRVVTFKTLDDHEFYQLLSEAKPSDIPGRTTLLTMAAHALLDGKPTTQADLLALAGRDLLAIAEVMVTSHEYHPTAERLGSITEAFHGRSR